MSRNSSDWSLLQREPHTRGKPADPQIYLEAAHIQDPGQEAHFVKFNYRISQASDIQNVNEES